MSVVTSCPLEVGHSPIDNGLKEEGPLLKNWLYAALVPINAQIHCWESQDMNDLQVHV